MDNLRLFDILPFYVAIYNKPDVLASKINGKWIKISAQEFIENANYVSAGLLALGINKGDKIASVSNNRYEWNFLDMGMLQIGVVHVPLYPTISETDYKFILNDAEVKMIVLSDETLFQKINPLIQNLPQIKIYTFNEVAGAKNFSEIIALGKQQLNTKKIEQIKAEIKAAELATLIYTSGTTGTPKGVMLSHANIMSNVIAVEHFPPVDQTCKALSFLPLNHVYERMLTYLYMYLGVSVYYAESIDTIGENLKEIKPEIFSTVPRLLEKVYDRIVGMGSKLKGIKKVMFFWALRLGEKYELNRKNGGWYEFQLKIANKFVFSKWREALGGKMRAMVSGSAALQPRLARIFWAARLYVLEGYGLTETSPVIAVNTLEPGNAKFGTVGPLIKEVQVKIAPDGEILIKGPNVMLGYYKKPALTAEAIDAEGWFHTGDIGMLEDGKFLKITDRKKEMFKTSGGKYIAPQPIENAFKESRFIEQIMVVGEGQKFAAALIVPSFSFLKDWCGRKNIPFSTHEEMIKNTEVLERIKKEVGQLNQRFGHVEQIKKFELLPQEWTINNGELTPTLKLKRKFITTKYQYLIDKMYKNDSTNS